MDVAHVVLSIVLALLLIATGSGKIIGIESSRKIRDSLNVPGPIWRAIGAFELIVVVGLVLGIWLHPVGVVAAVGVGLLMIGAIATRVRAGGEQRNSGVAADGVLLVVAVIATVIAVAA